MPDDDLVNLKHTVDHHDAELDTLVKRIQELEEYVRIIVRLIPTNIVETARQRSGGSVRSSFAGAQPHDPIAVEQYKRFFEKFAPGRIQQ